MMTKPGTCANSWDSNKHPDPVCHAGAGTGLLKLDFTKRQASVGSGLLYYELAGSLCIAFHWLWVVVVVVVFPKICSTRGILVAAEKGSEP